MTMHRKRYSTSHQRTLALLNDAAETIWQHLVERAEIRRCWRRVHDVHQADVRLRVEGETAFLYDAAAFLLVRTAATPEDVSARLQMLARAWALRDLSHAPHAPPHPAPLVLSLTTRDGRSVPHHADGVWEVTAGERVLVHVTNQTPQALFVVLLNIGADGTWTLLHPPTAIPYLNAGTTHTFGADGSLQATLPPGVAETVDTLKVLAFSESVEIPAWLGGLDEAPGSPSAFWAMLEKACTSSDVPSDVPWWYAHTTALRTVQPADSGAVADGQAFDVRILLPPGFGGDVRAWTQGQHVRVFEVPAPPGLQGVAEPLVLTSTHQRSAPAVALEIKGSPEDFAAVRPETPLRIGVPATRDIRGHSVVALAHDGEWFYPVGRGDPDGMVHITWLPPGGEASIGVRDWRRTVRLYFYRLTGLGADPLANGELHVARYVPPQFVSGHPGFDVHVLPTDDGGAVHYRTLHSNDLQPGMRIALIVHGFNSDSRHFVRALARFPKQGIGRAYDRLLTFDYESVGTSVWENAERLASAMHHHFGEQSGVQIDLFAHSMGTAVSRLALECEGGMLYVRRLFLAAVPNEGTLLAKAKDAATLLATILINRTVPQPQAFVLKWALGQIAETMQGIESLEPDSDVVRQLTQPVREPRIPYFVMAGNVVPEELAERARLERLYRVVARVTDAMLDRFFDDQHDLILNMRSMCALGNRGLYPAPLLDQRTLTCDHFHYFEDADALAIWRAWLK